ncbi:hypothetical protein Q7458_11885 [Glaesserella parasuis]|uniref:Uncharacterized protein n=1 Tax=Actinobacillus minor NM305 TaxID=637911 RepID=C5RYY5_9PAST|nr:MULTISPECIES: hypothetical protein [Pasteurellaceae]ATW42411.1 hypothetical protein A2U20_00590 [Glaesserella parasuis D74]ATW42457.1 hypothetical protein A2U20_00850 [Glaesserella parasuis D74]EER48122.1 hypothetical protein AM305_04568 [Actinobacillus minor NM305]EQA07944.1 hypothetical protein HPSD74_1753 [Glaesserella parasuis D74]MDG6474850.1 hypothetical protein [Glaesserella parasuis]
MAFSKFGKYIFPVIATAFSIDVLVPSISPLQLVPTFQKEIECDDYVVEETVRRFINEGIRAQNVQANKLAQFFVGHATQGLDRSNPLWDMFGRAMEGAGSIAEGTTKRGQNYIAFSSFESKEISDNNGVKKCRIMANSIGNKLSGSADYITHNYIVSIKGNQVTVD